MEVSMGCGFAGVTIVDENSVPIVAFTDVPVLGNSGQCGNNSVGGFDAAFAANPGIDFNSN
jgi:hypothetical protein